MNQWKFVDCNIRNFKLKCFKPLTTYWLITGILITVPITAMHTTLRKCWKCDTDKTEKFTVK